MARNFGVYALRPHRRVSAVRAGFLNAFPQDGEWVTKWSLAEKLHISEAYVRDLLREAQDARMVERGAAVPHRKSYAYTYRLTRLGRNRNGSAGHPRSAPVRSGAILHAERLLPNRYEGLGGFPGPIDQSCQRCGAQPGDQCYNMHWRAEAHRGGRRVPRPRLARPHRSRRAWRGHGKNATGVGVISVSAIDRPCRKCQAAPGEQCYRMNRWGRRLPGSPRKDQHHAQRTPTWVA